MLQELLVVPLGSRVVERGRGKAEYRLVWIEEVLPGEAGLIEVDVGCGHRLSPPVQIVDRLWLVWNAQVGVLRRAFNLETYTMAKAAANGPDNGQAQAATDPPTCGVMMPISAIEDCPASHWVDVRSIIEEAAEMAGFRARLVSAADYAGVILKEIIHNLYHDPIVVCDVSGRNPNVLFELGLRLAFDKPTILIKDDQTRYAFDTSPIEHLEYPRLLRYATIVEFKRKLAEKIQATHRQATTDKNYTTFLKHFGRFKVATVDVKEVSGQEFIMEELSSLKSMIRELSMGQRQSRIVGVSASTKPPADVFQAFVVRGIEPARLQEIREALERAKGIKTVRAEVIDDEIVVTLNSPAWLPQRLTHKIVQETVAKVRKDAVAYEVDM